MWGASFYRVRGEAHLDRGGREILEVVCEQFPRQRKAYFINDVRVPLAQFAGHLPVVVFLPGDLGLFDGAPQGRRRFLDRTLCQVSRPYLQTFSSYKRLLIQRNALLRSIREKGGDRALLSSWDQKLAEEGALLVHARLELTDILNRSLKKELMDLGMDWHEVRVTYERQGSARERGGIGTELLTLLRSSQERDCAMQATTVGPHRDDWHVIVDGKKLSSFASRGEQRVCLVALLFLQVAYIELHRGEKPIILLDDVFSELDDSHQGRLLDSLGAYQVFLTAVRRPAASSQQMNVWNVSVGRVCPLEGHLVRAG